MPSDTEYAYLAGIIDGEGHVRVSIKGSIVLCMADVDILYWCHDHFGGTLSGRWKSERNARPRRIWGLYAKPQLIEHIPRITPYAVLKRNELNLLLEWAQLTTPGGSLRRNDPRAIGWHAERDRIAAEAAAIRVARKARS